MATQRIFCYSIFMTINVTFSALVIDCNWYDVQAGCELEMHKCVSSSFELCMHLQACHIACAMAYLLGGQVNISSF